MRCLQRLRLAKVVKSTYRLHIGARVNAALLTYLLTFELCYSILCLNDTGLLLYGCVNISSLTWDQHIDYIHRNTNCTRDSLRKVALDTFK